MKINEIITNLSTFKKESDIENSNYKNRYEELKNMISYCCDVWNNVVYSFKKINQEIDKNFDPRFYYQAIVFNLYMLGAITKNIGTDILKDNIDLKYLRDNIAHMNEKLNQPLNIVSINEIYPNAIERKGDYTYSYNVPLIGLNIYSDNLQVSSPLGIVGDTVFSSLKPSNKYSQKYDGFVSYKMTEENLVEIQKKLLILLKKNYFDLIKLKPEKEVNPLINF